MKKVKLGFALLGAIMFLLSACNEENGTAKLTIALIDAPADYQEVNIDVQEVQVLRSEADTGFVSIDSSSIGIVNLLELTGGLEAILADVELPAGKLHQIRLILGDENTLMIDDEIKELTVPSASKSGLKVKVDMDLVDGEPYRIVLDFDVAKSVVKAGNSGKYLLKPVIRAIVEAGEEEGSSIKGSVSPVVFANVAAILNADTINTFTNDMGKFHIKGLEVGTYTVLITPGSESGLDAKEISGIEVLANESTDVGVVVFE